jgi:hypothetical protein
MPEAAALERASFVIDVGGGYFSCNAVCGHEWFSEESLLRDLKAAGFTTRTGWSDSAHDYLSDKPVPVRKAVKYERGATGILFDLLFPESENFRSNILPEAKHCIHRAMGHLSGDVQRGGTSSYPSTVEGVLVPVATWQD